VILPMAEEDVLRASELSFRKRVFASFECGAGTTQIACNERAIRDHLFETLALISGVRAGSLMLGARALQRSDLALLGQSPSIPKALTAVEFLAESTLACANEGDARAVLAAFGLRAVCDRALGSLSPPTRKAIALVKVLVSKRPVKVMHEPLAGLAPEVVPYVHAALLSMRHGICIVITENAFPLAQSAHHTVYTAYAAYTANLNASPPSRVVVIVAAELARLTAHLDARKYVYDIRGNTLRLATKKLSDDLPVLQQCIALAGIPVHSLSFEPGA
jgi:ABC-type transport system involved in cytochrome c biogenesis ATPase subunit